MARGIPVYCKINGCDTPANDWGRGGGGRGMCPKHYRQWLRTGSPHRKLIPNKGRVCEAPGCLNPAKTRLRCAKHYARILAHKKREKR